MTTLASGEDMNFLTPRMTKPVLHEAAASIDVGRMKDEILHLLDAGILELLAVKDVHGGGDFLHVLLAFVGRDLDRLQHDLFPLFLCFLGENRPYGRGDQRPA